MDDETRPEARSSPPRYCPRLQGGRTLRGPALRRVRRDPPPARLLATCERFWKLDPGTECPKHDVELLDEAPPAEAFGSLGERAMLVTVATFSHPNEANAPRIRLEAEGIPTFLDGERIAGSTLWQVATGGVRLQVPSTLASAARILISQTWSPPIEPDEDLDDAWEDLHRAGCASTIGHEAGHHRPTLRPRRALVALDVGSPAGPRLGFPVGQEVPCGTRRFFVGI